MIRRYPRSLEACVKRSKLSSSGSFSRIEPLESRKLFAAAHITSIVTDNRGEVNVTFDQPLNPLTVKTSNIQMHTAGGDGVFGTADDLKITGVVRLKVGNRRIWFRPSVAVPFVANSTYSFKITSKNVKDAQGNRIDGEFNGPGLAGGDGVAGGDTLFLSKRDKTGQTARFSTVAGNIDVNLDLVNTPGTVSNFLTYANNGLYDFSFIHRSIVTPTPFVIQGGGFNASLTDNTVTGLGVIPTGPAIQNEFHTSNTRGTIAMAKLGGDPNSATDQWFFNLGDNASNLDTQNGGFTVFGSVKNAGGLATMDAIAALPIQDLSAAPTNPSDIAGNMTDTPVVQNVVPASFAPLNDLVIIRRIAILNKVVAFPLP
jgi:cyclophilin family peptidyl-prolyl cis-trans isomerase